MDESTPKALRGRTLSESLLDDGKTVKIPLTQKKFALVDLDDFHLVSNWKWYALKGKRDFRAGGHCYEQDRTALIHRVIFPEAKMIDHKNLDPLDNRRENLRACTKSQNFANSRKQVNESGFKGVSRCKTQWVARIGTNGKYLGTFENPIEAAKAYDKAAREMYREFARPNFPEDYRE